MKNKKRAEEMMEGLIASNAASRFIAISLVLVSALYFTLVGLTNVFDWGTNFEFVKHVLSMDTLFTGSDLTGRAITTPALWDLFYVMIIVWELLAAGVLWYGGFQLSKNRDADPINFANAKTYALYGLGIGLLLWFLAFITIGGEWFLMWRSSDWSGIQSAFRMFTIMGIAALFLQQTK